MRKLPLIKLTLLVILLLVANSGSSPSAKGAQDADEPKSRMSVKTFKGLALRNIGPAF